ncbi:MAG: vWA domain-containing protein [Rubrobacteraceae bacterium]
MKPGNLWRIVAALAFLGIFMLTSVACGGSQAGEKDGRGSKSDKAQGSTTHSLSGRSSGEKTGHGSEASNTQSPAELSYQKLLAKFGASKITEPTSPEKSYEQRLAKFGQDYGECAQKTTNYVQACKKPASLGNRDLKQNINVQLILDASGSMQGEVGGERKIDIAWRALTDFVGTLPEQANVSLRVYGQVGSSAKSDRARSCAASELILPFQKLDRSKFSEAINSFEPKGWTPVADSLKKARDDFSGLDPSTNSNFVYLVSDGVETCGGDPVSAARSLAANDIQAEVNIIGFDVNPQATRQLQQAAKSGGGEYYDAGNAAGLNEIFRKKFDWTEWTAYYNCLISNAYNKYNETSGNAYRNYNCITGKAYGEYNAMSGAAYSKYDAISGGECSLYNKISGTSYTKDEYKKYRDGILALAAKRRDVRIEAATKERDYTVEHAKEKRDGLVDPAVEKRKATVDEAIKDRDVAIKKAEEGKSKSNGN